MNSKERVRAAISHTQPDIVPADFAGTSVAWDNLKKHFQTPSKKVILNNLNIDIRLIVPNYKGHELKSYYEDSMLVKEHYFGWREKAYWNGKEYNNVVSYYPLNAVECIEDLKKHNWPRADWFDYESVKRKCEENSGKALIIGDAGVYQFATFLREASLLYMDMALNPEIAQHIFDKMVEFELEYYSRIMEAADGQIDILRVYDDYGTQTSTLFSIGMWKDFFENNTKKLTQLAHSYGAKYMQHSCGAVRTIIPHLINCGVDILDPIQKVVGMEIEDLKKEFGDKLCFHGGIDTQKLLPFGTPQEIMAEAKYYIETLSKSGGYILYPSQEFQGDVPVENILAMYNSRYLD